MSKNAKTLMRALERAQEAAETSRSNMTAAMAVGPSVEMEACAALLIDLEAYLGVNRRLQAAINAGYGDSPREIASKAVKSKFSN